MTRMTMLLAGAAALFVTTAARAEPVTLEVWTVSPPDYHQTMAAEFEKANPDIKINVKVVQFPDVVNDLARAVATGGAPDVTYVDNPDIALLVSKGLLTDLTPMVAASSIVKPADIYPGPLSAATYEDKLYAVPRGANTIALYYNADMFKAKGLDPEKPPTTWDEFHKAAKALNDPANNVYGLAFSAVGTEEGTFQFLPWLQMAGGDYDKLDTPGGIKALEFWQTLLDEKLASPDTLVRGQYDSTATFNAGNAAMVISGPWELPRMSKEAKFDWRVAMLPLPEPGAPRASALGEGDNVVLAASEHPAEAFRFVEYMYSQMPRVWNEFGYLPASKVSVSDPQYAAAFKTFDESMKFARNRGPSPEWSKISKAIYTAVQSALTHQSDAATALKTAQATIDGLPGR
ncbi:multiple sugar transport system substrate-binding protein [Aureimonas pseudogalii]|uniref:Multiple sugar transport system substrate-binding protein n=2 Tax=Aureimonas pseudogalii TaxID=1744844 RepID=A0A7W6H8W1_9HYPH|nr:multiple sugar transport system substrate-binding protein [Aureimonas pseudogalii]